MKKSMLLLLIVTTIGIIGCNHHSPPSAVEKGEENGIMEIDSTVNLMIYYPQFTHIDLVCENMPRPADGDVVMCIAAAFTGQQSEVFDHDNIAGNHVSHGIFHKGYDCPVNSGSFAYYGKQWHFAQGNHTDNITQAADNSGMAFAQIMLIYDGERCPYQVSGRSRFRALCEKDHRLCIIEGRRLQDISFFTKCLESYGVRHALYLQPGKGWNYSWYRDNAGVVHIMHPKTHDYSTNWLTFYANHQEF